MLLTILLKEGFSFQMLCSTPKFEEFVWFDETEHFNHRAYSKQVTESLRKTPYDPLLEEMVWFDFQDGAPHANIHTQNKVLDGLQESKEGISDSWQNEDEAFANYFFSNNWK